MSQQFNRMGSNSCWNCTCNQQVKRVKNYIKIKEPTKEFLKDYQRGFCFSSNLTNTHIIASAYTFYNQKNHAEI